MPYPTKYSERLDWSPGGQASARPSANSIRFARREQAGPRARQASQTPAQEPARRDCRSTLRAMAAPTLTQPRSTMLSRLRAGSGSSARADCRLAGLQGPAGLRKPSRNSPIVAARRPAPAIRSAVARGGQPETKRQSLRPISTWAQRTLSGRAATSGGIVQLMWRST